MTTAPSTMKSKTSSKSKASAEPSTFLDTGLVLLTNPAYKVKCTAPETVRFGRKEIELAEHEMPGLMALRAEFKGRKPLKGARVSGLAAHDDSNGCPH
jgi:adenosylhomocysteinase